MIRRVLALFLILDGLVLACIHCGPRALSSDSRDGIQHAVTLDRMSLRYLDAGSDPGILLTASACSLRGVLAREGAPLPKDDAGPLVGCPQ